jgi:hypothetical protein
MQMSVRILSMVVSIIIYIYNRTSVNVSIMRDQNS